MIEQDEINPILAYVLRTRHPINVKIDGNWEIVHVLDWAYDLTREKRDELYNRHILPSIRAWEKQPKPRYMTVTPPQDGYAVWEWSPEKNQFSFRPIELVHNKMIGILKKISNRWYCIKNTE